MTLPRGRRQKGVRGECRTGKLRFATEHAAQQALAKAEHDPSPKRGETRTYACPWCHGVHLTSIPAEPILSDCHAVSLDGFPCTYPEGCTGQPHRWESPVPDAVPSVEWT